MLYLVDTADVEAIAKADEFFPLAGTTTNPTIISKARRDFFAIMKDIRSIMGDRMIHAQVVGERSDEMLKDAAALMEKVGGNLYIKVPVTPEGYKAMRAMKKELTERYRL